MNAFARRMLLIAAAIVALPFVSSSQWTPADCGLTEVARYLAVNGTTLFAATSGGVYSSTDEGLSWSLVSAPLPASGSTGTHFAVSQTHLFFGREHAYVSAINGSNWVYSDDGLGAGPFPGTPNWVSSITVTGTKLLVGTSVGVFVSTDTGVSWSASGLDSYDVRVIAASGTDVYAGLKGGSAYYSSNSGSTWTHISAGLPMNIPEPIRGFAFCGAYVFASTYDDALYLSTSPSAAWIPANTGLPNGNGPYYNYSAAGAGGNFYAGSKDGVYGSTDGVNWSPFNDGLRAEAVAGGAGAQGLAVCGSHVFAVVWDSTGTRVWRRALADPVPIQLEMFTASMMDGSRVNLYWKTASETGNYGFEIQKSNSPPEYRSVPDLFIPGHGTTVVPHEYHWTDPSGEAGDYYRLKQIDLDGTWHFSEGVRPASVSGVRDESTRPDRFSMEQNYPNPFNPSTTIRFAVPVRSHVRLSIFNALGQEVAALLNSVKEAGSYEVRLEGSNLASGLYFYRLTAGDFVQTRKLLLLR
jgi:hypothetical protein